MDYPKSTPNVGLVGGKFVDENTSTGQAGSLIPATWGNSVTDELLAVIVAAGLTPSEGDLTQLQKAIQTLAASDVKRTVRVATTGAIALSGVQTIDGVALVAGNRVLVKDQAAGSQNGIYTVAAGAWVRALDANESAECVPGHLVIVESGTAHGGAIWQLSNTTLPTLGTTALVYSRVFGKTGVAAGTYRSVTIDVQGRITAGSNPTTLAGYGITDVYTQTQVDNLLAGKVGNATTLAGYGITDAYTQSQVNALLAAKAPLASPAFTGIPTVPTAAAGTNNLQAANTAFVQAAIAALVGSSPAALDTLKELADAIGNDPNFATTMLNALASKANKATTLAGYGITDAQPYSDYLSALHVAGGWGLGTNVPTAAGATWDSVSATRTSFVKGTGPNGVTIFAGLHIQVDDTRYFDLAARIDQLCFRTYEGTGAATWRQIWHSGNFDPTQYVQTNQQAGADTLGLAKIASNAQVIAGADDATIVTPKKLRLGFSAVFGDNGYVAFPSWLGGFIVQWGTAVDDGATRAFPTGFPTQCFCLIGGVDSDSYSGGADVKSYIVNRTQFRLREGSGATPTINLRYIALGN